MGCLLILFTVSFAERFLLLLVNSSLTVFFLFSFHFFFSLKDHAFGGIPEKWLLNPRAPRFSICYLLKFDCLLREIHMHLFKGYQEIY